MLFTRPRAFSIEQFQPFQSGQTVIVARTKFNGADYARYGLSSLLRGRREVKTKLVASFEHCSNQPPPLVAVAVEVSTTSISLGPSILLYTALATRRQASVLDSFSACASSFACFSQDVFCR